MYTLMNTNPAQLVLGTVIIILVFGLIYVDHYTTGVIDSLNLKVKEYFNDKIATTEYADKLTAYTDSVEVKSNQVAQYADSVSIVSTETIEENNRLKIQLTEKESLIKKYKFENNELLNNNESLTSDAELNGTYLDHYSDSIKTLREEVNKRDFIIEELKQDKDSLIQQINNYKVQTDAVNQLIKDTNKGHVLVHEVDKGFGKTGIISIAKQIKVSKSKRHG